MNFREKWKEEREKSDKKAIEQIKKHPLGFRVMVIISIWTILITGVIIFIVGFQVSQYPIGNSIMFTSAIAISGYMYFEMKRLRKLAFPN